MIIYTSNVTYGITVAGAQLFSAYSLLNPENEMLMVVVLEDVGEGLKQDRTVEIVERHPSRQTVVVKGQSGSSRNH